MFVLQRTDGKYVSKPGSVHSYTSKLEHAQTFASSEQAKNASCPENERVVSVTELLRT